MFKRVSKFLLLVQIIYYEHNLHCRNYRYPPPLCRRNRFFDVQIEQEKINPLTKKPHLQRR